MKMVNFATDFLCYALKGGSKFYTWLLFLGFFIMIWAYGNYTQISQGMIVTGLNDQVSWGLYMSNFVFLVGVAAAAVTIVFPAYVYNYKPLKDVVIIGEMLAISAVIMCILFVLSHMGRPDRLWHIMPVIGILNWPNSMLTWDVIVLNVYLGLNVVCGFYYMYKKYTGEPVNKVFYMTLVYVSIVWALSIHTVTGFLLNTMPTRPMWFHSMVPIKFIVTAFSAGPAFIILAFFIIRKNTKLEIKDEAINMLSTIITFCLSISLFLTLCEIVTELYPSTEHSFSLKYLLFGKHGLSGLVGFFWASLAMNIIAFILLINPRTRKNHAILPYTCAILFVGIWIEKGMAFVLPGMTPSPIGEFAEYTPSWIEIGNSLGAWAIGLAIFTILAKGAIGIQLGDVKYSEVKGEQYEK
ncbi:MAG: polysulfide reductase NrfD [Proteobacteria bacterium]|nr:polysulfide reductase NrfD [Pseudomonadota bacterium]